MIVLVLNDKQRPFQPEGMRHCMETSTNFKRMDREGSRQDYKDMLGYLVANDFERVGHLTSAMPLLCMRRLEQPLQPLATFDRRKPQSYGLCP